MNKILYFDCFSGISGDMLLGSFLDLGIEENFLRNELKKLPIDSIDIKAEKKSVHSIAGTFCRVILSEKEQPHRHMKEITEIIQNSTLPKQVKQMSISVFTRLAQAESRVHSISADKVHFHEIGALDSILDIVGSCICINHLKPDRIFTSPINTGRGKIRCEHGLLPVPPPAVLELLRQSHLPFYADSDEGERATPTGVAILSEFATPTDTIPKIALTGVGYGFGEREFSDFNGLRVLFGE